MKTFFCASINHYVNQISSLNTLIMRKLTFLLFLLIPIGLWAQDSQVIKGKVIDGRTKEALPGVSIYVDNTTIGLQQQEGVVSNYQIGTVSDTDGNFSLKIPRTVKQVTFSMIGFENQVLALTDIDSYTVRMEESFTEINEVMVTGYQKIPKSKVTGAMEKIYSKEILQQSTPNIDEMLKGQVAGVQIESTSGAPGAPARIRIRGTATLGGKTDPLWVLDGMPLEGDDVPDMEGKDIDQLVNTSIAGINPADIESITILKDAAATAIYGARAANGVIVIITKQGEKGSIRVNATTNWFVNSRPDMDRLHLLNSNQKVDLELALAARPDLTFRNNKGQVARILNNANEFDLYQSDGFDALSSETQSLINTLRNTNTNWGDELYQTALSQNHTLSISGGSDKATYYFSTGYYDEQGTTTGTSMNRLNLTLKTEFQVKDWLNFGVSVFANQRKQESYLTGTDAFTNPSRYSRNANPYLPVYNEDGTYAYDPEIEGYSDRYIDYNIIEERENTSNEQTVFNTSTIFDLEIDFTQNLNLTSQFGFTTDRLSNEKTGKEESYYARKEYERSRRYDSSTKDFYYFLPKGGVIKNLDQYTYQWNSKTMLNYTKEFNNKHSIDVMLGAEFRKNKVTKETSNAYGFDEDTYEITPILFPDASDAEIFPLYRKAENVRTFASFFGTFNYTFKHKYSLFSSLRHDGSSAFGVDKRNRNLPIYSIGTAWNVSQEKWLQNAHWLTFLKARLAYGLQGNFDDDTPAYVIGEYKKTTILPGNTEKTIIVTTPPNDKLQWEKTTNWNLGIDLGLFHNRISATADLYYRRSVDLIAPEAIPLETGFSIVSRNWGELTNKGIELTLTTDNIKTKDFNWTTTINIAKNINRVKKININEKQTNPSKEGHSINSIFAFPTNGLDDQGYPAFVKDGKDCSLSDFFEITETPYGTPISQLSNAEIRNLYKEMGSTDPKISGGIINNFSYKNWDLKVSANFYLKQWKKETPFYSMTQFDRGQNTTESIYDVWSPDSPNGKYPGIVGPNSFNGERFLDYYWVYGIGQTVNTFNNLDIWYKEISYIRINSIRLGYSLPASICSKMGLANAKVNLEAKNPFVIGTDYSGYFDPETYGNIYSQPIAKSYMIGLNVTF
jgi:TonB-linked SusC/RagA family outer membrane protein